MSTALAEHVSRLIAENGPISTARYMEEALGHPSLGYYIRKDPFGAAGDFITAPEISQMFGELIGLWCAEVWRLMGRPDPVALVELGPGRGTLMADLLRAARIVPDFATAIDLHLVETSPRLRQAQRDRIARPCAWHADFATVPRGPLLLIANEFFDALPVRQFVRTEHGWRERRVGLAAAGDGFRFVLASRPPADARIPPAVCDAPVGSLIEIGAERARAMNAIAGRIAGHGGAALIIDYGHPRTACGDTLQAVRDHRFADPLAAPGEADLTAHVDFEALGHAARDAGAAIAGPVDQGVFLKRLGIARRAETLAAGAGPAGAPAITAALERLTAPDQMGRLFQVLSVHARALPEPPGFWAA